MGKNCPSPSQTLPRPEKTFFRSGRWSPSLPYGFALSLSALCAAVRAESGQQAFFPVSPGTCQHAPQTGGRRDASPVSRATGMAAMAAADMGKPSPCRRETGSSAVAAASSLSCR